MPPHLPPPFDWVAHLAYWSSWVTLFGLPISLLGLGLTYKSAQDAKRAAENAENASRETLKLANSVSVISQLSSLQELMISIKEIHRSSRWEIAIERYDKLRSLIIEIKTSEVSEENAKKLTACQGQFSVMETSVEKFLSRGAPIPDVIKFNKFTSEQIDVVREILAEAKQGVTNGN